MTNYKWEEWSTGVMEYWKGVVTTENSLMATMDALVEASPVIARREAP